MTKVNTLRAGQYRVFISSFSVFLGSLDSDMELPYKTTLRDVNTYIHVIGIFIHVQYGSTEKNNTKRVKNI